MLNKDGLPEGTDSQVRQIDLQRTKQSLKFDVTYCVKAASKLLTEQLLVTEIWGGNFCRLQWFMQSSGSLDGITAP